MKKSEDLDLGINPRPINETEARQLALVLNLLKHKSGLNFSKIRSLMPDYYSNENSESDQKKLQRDIDDLKKLGFSVGLEKQAESGDLNVYKISTPVEEKTIHFSKEELNHLSFSIIENFEEFFSLELFTACQKIFHQNMDLFPFSGHKLSSKEREDKNSNEFFTIVNAIKNKTPLKIQYYRTIPSEKEEKEIDPIHIIKRNSRDFYLIAFDRKKKEKRRYLIPKILKVQEIAAEFMRDYKITSEDLNYHALHFAVHDSVELNCVCDPSFMWKLENFLYPHPFEKKENSIQFQTTNQSALFSFLWKEPNVVIGVNSQSFLNEYEKFIDKLKNEY